MRSFIALSALIGALVAPTSWAQDTALPQPDQAIPGEMRALAVLEADREDFGRRRAGETLTRRIAFVNSLDSPVSVEVIGSSCGCLAPSFDRNRLMPAEEAILTIRLVTVPGGLEQAHHVSFRASWVTDDGERRSEQGICAIRYQPENPFSVRPEFAAVAQVQGKEATADFFIRQPQSPEETPDFTAAACTLPGWRIARIDDPRLPVGVVRYQASGQEPSVGFRDGAAQWWVEGSDLPVLSIPIRVRTLSPYRMQPGGAVFVRTAGQGAQTEELELIARADEAPEPARVVLTDAASWIECRLHGRSLLVRLDPGAEMPPVGSARARVLDENGAELLDFPIAWYTKP